MPETLTQTENKEEMSYFSPPFTIQASLNMSNGLLYLKDNGQGSLEYIFVAIKRRTKGERNGSENKPAKLDW